MLLCMLLVSTFMLLCGMQGASLFYAGWLIPSSPFEFAPQLLVKEWFGTIVGYIAGSCSLFAASYVMLLEVSEVSVPLNYDRLPS